MIFTTGNIITFVVCLFLLTVFRQLDKSNRSIEKVKKFGDKLKADLDQYINEKMVKLEESTVSLNVEQTRAIAAVKRLESIREDFAAKEQSLVENTAAVDEIGKKIAAYDETMRMLIEMTSRAETNLAKITGESDFADSLGKKLMASQKQLGEISESISGMKQAFTEENREALSSLARDALERVGSEIGTLENRLSLVHQETGKTFAAAETAFAELYKKAMAEAARKADSLEDAAFTKLKEQAGERLAKYRETIEEKTAALHELAKTRMHETQVLVKNFRSEWQTEADEFLEATRAEILQFKSDFSDSASRIEDQVASAEAAAAARSESLRADFHSLQNEVERNFADFATELETKTAEVLEINRAFLEKNRSDVERVETEIASSVETLEASVQQSIRTLAEKNEHMLSDFDALLESSAAQLSKHMQARIDSVRKDLFASLEDLSARTSESIAAVSGKADEAAAVIGAQNAASIAAVAEKSSAETLELEKSFQQRLSGLASALREELARVETETKTILDTAQSRLESFSSSLSSSIDSSSEKAADHFGQTVAAIENRLDSYRKDVEYRLEQFTSHLSDADRLEARLRETMEDTENRVTGDFTLYTREMANKQEQFEQKIAERGDTLSRKMLDLENGLNELKSRAYDNVSEKLKVFEDDFFKDLAQRGEAITTELERWQRSVAEKLELLASESESARKDAEAAYEAELKDRLAAIGDQYRQYTARLEEQIATVEASLRTQITASDQSILAFVEQFRAEFAQTREAASLHVKNELEAHALSVQEILRKQEREVDARTKEFVQSIETSKSDAENQVELLKSEFSAWQSKNGQQLAASRQWLEEQIASFSGEARQSIDAVASSWQEQFRDFAAKTAEERKQLKDSLETLKRDMVQSGAEFDRRAAEALSGFDVSWKALASESELRLREQSADTEQTLRSLKALAQDIRETVEQNREKSFQKIQQDTATLGATLEEIDRRQKGFVAQTKLFERADQLKIGLETDIERLSAEVGRLDTFKESMVALEQQYIKIRKLEEEATQKLSKFTADKKRIDILETDFGKLLGLSDSIDKKLLELTGTNDDLQQIQVQLRRFDETIGDVNSRYERLEKKALVLDRTVEGIDAAFEQLRSVETAVAEYRKTIEAVPSEIEELGRTLGELRDTGGKAALVMERLSALDSILEDVEKRTEKMQTAREWLARTETRLEEISRQSQDQLKLLSDLLKGENPAKKSKGAPPIGIRENVVKLAHQGWKVDEIARALHLSRGEVELILELPSN